MTEDENALTIVYMDGYHTAKRQWVSLTDDEIREGSLAADPERMDLCAWSFRKGVEFAEQKLKERNT